MQSFEGASPVFILTGFIVIAFVITFIGKILSFGEHDEDHDAYEQPIEFRKKSIPFQIPYVTGYQKANIFTRREYMAYFTLKEITDEKGLVICPKVRLLDIVKPIPGTKKYSTLRNKVMSKHVDFVICKANMEIYAIVELDDSTHLRPDRIQRDNFVDSVLHSVGYPIIHTYAITSDIFDNLPPV